MQTIYIPATGMAFFRQIRRGLFWKFKLRALKEYQQQQRSRSIASRYVDDPTGSIWNAWSNSFTHRLKDKFILYTVNEEKEAAKDLIADWDISESVKTLTLKLAYDAGEPLLKLHVDSWKGIKAAFDAIDPDIQKEEILSFASTAADGIISQGWGFFNGTFPPGVNWLRVAHEYGQKPH
tara:strand:+ start:52 stop:588 length:537 start_codon:yes stop_codon:yes gene_type:complete